MSERKLKAAILGLNANGLQLLQTAVDTGLYSIEAVAGSDPDVVVKTAKQYDCAGYDDYRQLVIQNELDVLLVASEAYVCDEYMRAAMKKGVHVIKTLPPGVDFEQTAELVRTARRNDVQFATVNLGRFTSSFEALREYLKEHDGEQVHLILGFCYMPEPEDPYQERWLSDPELAGGGVILRNCYEIVDQIVSHFGLPQQVYSLHSNRAPDKQQRMSITEDTAVVTMKFSDTLMGNLIASRRFGPYRNALKVHYDDKYFNVTQDHLTVFDNPGNVIEDRPMKVDMAAAQTRMLAGFAQSLLRPEEEKFAVEPQADLHVMAVIQAAYLSAKTGMPEEPSRILRMAGAEPGDFLSKPSQGV